MATFNDLTHTIVDALATHQVLHSVRGGENHERERIVIGAGMAALGYRYGPDLEKRLKQYTSGDVSAAITNPSQHALGEAVLGGIAGYFIGGSIKTQHAAAQKTADTIQHALDVNKLPATIHEDDKQPLLLLGSLGWLTYSVIANNRESPHDRQQQLWALGAGTVGYLWGPGVYAQLRNVNVPTSLEQEAGTSYARAGAALGAALGLIHGGKR